MYRILSLGALALATLLATEQQAPAWVNFKFSAGVNWHWQSGNNTLLWGAFKDGAPPGPEFFNPYGQQGPGNFGSHPYGPQDFQYFGAAPRSNGNSQPASTPTPVPTGQQAYNYSTIPGWSPSNVFQPVSYTPYYYQSAPSYWYGR